MRLLLRLPFVVLLILIFISPASAELLTLRDAVNIALLNNPGLKSFRWSVEAQKEDVHAAKGSLYPTFTVEERFQRTNNPTYGFMAKLNQERFTQEDFRINSLNDPDDISDFQTSIGFEQPLFVPGIYKSISMASRELEAQESLLHMKKNEVILNVVKTFHLIQTAEEYLKTTRKGLKDAEEHRRLASLRYESGMGLYSDVLRAKVAYKRAEAMIVKAEGNLEVARRSLGLILGRSEPVYVTGENTQLTLDDLQVYLDASLHREDLKALRARHEGSQKALDMEKSAFLPSIGLGGRYFMNDHKDPFSPEGESYMLMGLLKWNFFDASAYHRIKKAKAKVHEADEHFKALEKDIHFSVNEAYLRVREKDQKLALAKAVLEEAEEALRLVRTRYENSLAPIVDLLDTQVMLDTARAELIEAENEYTNAVAVLYYQSGMLRKTFIQQ